ncbi:linoleate 9S-lipoxygenase 2-like [Triticum dicoccoides]|uniref:linoleate 9S-lipoxygenase 2-like n=1 Tax=Triticum dicoccoides TaxID=85692 RepID=UPI00162D7C89|nr:linoleate 9S-lipoxygenase 2-like [Triticum dicoccoides]
MFGGGLDIIGGITGSKTRLKGSVVLTRKNALDFNDLGATVMDNVTEFLGRGVTCQLISSTIVDSNNGNRGKVGAEASLEQWITSLPFITVGENKFSVNFDWAVDKLGVPGAIIVKNNHASEFFLKTITLDNVPGHGKVVFVANSWVYPQAKYRYSRVFFANDTYLPSKMPAALKPYRDDELRNLRGDDQQGPYEAHDRVYRYDVYHDLGDSRQILGGSKEFPYPRRCRTGRKLSQTNPDRESRLLPLVQSIYVPRDELFGHLKKSDFLGYSLKALVEGIIPAIRTYVDLSPGEFDSFADILKLYEGGIKLPDIPALQEMRKRFPLQLVKDLIPMGGDYLLKPPKPQVIKQDEKAWMTDAEFAREILAGVNPMMITRVTEFPPKSTLDPSQYGDHTSTITEAHIGLSLEGLTVQQAVASNRLYILDHHDHMMPYLVRLNNLDDTFLYATRTLLFLKGDGTLAPVAIELSTPLLEGGLTTAKSTVYTPASTGVEAWIWQLAKAYVCVNDYGYHQLVSHWLNTHAVMEPFIIATNRQLSVTHPVHKLLHPHYRDTMNINSRARELLVSAGGIIELTVFQRKYAMEMSSVTYKDWNFNEQALPDDLIKRGMAVRDPSSPHKVRLLLEDYPYAVDGLAIWTAIEQWVTEYLAIYYTSDSVLQSDVELQAWWKEVREVGHGDLKDAAWWPKMKTVAELVKACATIIWTGSALHAAVNFGQYPYAGYHPNKPSASRRPMPEPDSEEYSLLARDPEKVFIRTITNQMQAIIGISLLEILSKHSSDEIYLGQRDTPEWTSDAKALEAFKRFGTRLEGIESQVVALNGNPQLKNRNGPAQFPYMLLYPNTSDHTGEAEGLTARGIPNSISI